MDAVFGPSMTETCHAPRGIQDILFPMLGGSANAPAPCDRTAACSPSIDKRTYAGILIFGIHNMIKPQTPRDGGVRASDSIADIFASGRRLFSHGRGCATLCWVR